MVSDEQGQALDRYAFSVRVLHWLMALGFIFMWVCGYAMTSLVAEDSPLEESLFSLHISIGVTLAGLLAFRLVLRFLNRPPAPVDGLAGWERVGSHLGHLGLYVLPIAAIAAGWAETDFGGHGVNWFAVPMPKLFSTKDTLWGLNLEETLAILHQWFAYVMLALAGLHVAAVLKHRWLDGHDVLYRMTFGPWKRDRQL